MRMGACFGEKKVFDETYSDTAKNGIDSHKMQ